MVQDSSKCSSKPYRILLIKENLIRCKVRTASTDSAPKEQVRFLLLMGAGASASAGAEDDDLLDEAAVKNIVGSHFNQQLFDEAAEDGTITRRGDSCKTSLSGRPVGPVMLPRGDSCKTSLSGHLSVTTMRLSATTI